MTSAFPSLADRARQLVAAREVSTTWEQDLVDAMERASDQDLGTLVVVHAVLATLEEERQAELARQQAERDRVAADQREQARVARRAGRRDAFSSQLLAHGLLTVLYTCFSVWVMVTTQKLGALSWSGLVDLGWPILRACLMPLIAALVLDWFLENPAGPLRRLWVGTGGLIGLGSWFYLALLGGYGNYQVAPWAIGIGWIVGSLFQFIYRQVAPDGATWAVSQPVARARPWLRVGLALGVISAISATFFGNCVAECVPAAQASNETASFAHWMHFDPLGIGQSWAGLVGLVAVGWSCYLFGFGLIRRSPRLGLGLVVAGPVAGVVALFAYSPNFVSLLVGLITGAIR